MQITVSHNMKQIQDAIAQCANQVPFALMNAMNKTALQAKSEIQTEMPRVFDRPTPWVINSLRISFATKARLIAELAYKDKNSVESSRTMIEPHVQDVPRRHFKAMEARLFNIGLLPANYNAVPGAGAKIDANGNMSQGQITQLLNVLGAYTEAGYNKANSKTVVRLAKGNVKKGIYGFEYFAVKVGAGGRAGHLKSGIYQRVITGFGTSLKPILMFVKLAKYKQRLDFYGIAQRVVDRDLPSNFDKAFEDAMKTALPKQVPLL